MTLPAFSFAQRLLARLGRYELSLLLVPGFVAGAVWLFIELADEILEGETHRIDRALLLAMRKAGDLAEPIGPRWLEEMMRDVTAFGSPGPLVFLTLAAVIYLLLRRRHRTALFVFLAVGGGQLLSSLLKLGFDRPRPDLVPHGMTVYTASFPSGHAMMAAVTYLTLGALLARTETRRRLKAYIMLLALLLTLLIGISRVYLGVHWPSDVLGGWIAGSAWAAMCWSLAVTLQRRGRLERENAPEDSDPSSEDRPAA